MNLDQEHRDNWYERYLGEVHYSIIADNLGVSSPGSLDQVKG